MTSVRKRKVFAAAQDDADEDDGYTPGQMLDEQEQDDLVNQLKDENLKLDQQIKSILVLIPSVILVLNVYHLFTLLISSNPPANPFVSSSSLSSTASFALLPFLATTSNIIYLTSTLIPEITFSILSSLALPLYSPLLFIVPQLLLSIYTINTSASDYFLPELAWGALCSLNLAVGWIMTSWIADLGNDIGQLEGLKYGYKGA